MAALKDDLLVVCLVTLRVERKVHRWADSSAEPKVSRLADK